MKLTEVLEYVTDHPETKFRKMHWNVNHYVMINKKEYTFDFFDTHTNSSKLYVLYMSDIKANNWEIIEEDKTPGQIAYEASLHKDYSWNDLALIYKDNWEEIATAILDNEKE